MAVQISQKVFTKDEIKKVQHEKWGGIFPIDNFESLEIEDDWIVFVRNNKRMPLIKEEITIEFMPGVISMDLKARQNA